jgi:beta-glucanase (GH16 family)
MGNLGKPGYPASTEGLWPYSYWDKCDAGITPNQSSIDGISWLPGMKLPACTCQGQDHPSPGKSRSAPEIDALEATVNFMGPGRSHAVGSVSQSAQFAPFDIWYQPDYGEHLFNLFMVSFLTYFFSIDFIEVYDNSITQMNAYRGGPFQQALSGLSTLNNDWYNGNQYQIFGFEYEPGSNGQITWYVGEQAMWKLDGRAVRPNGNIGQRPIPEEPMSVIMNFGMSPSFSQLDLVDISQLLPATMRFDYIRIYQDPNNMMVTCDPPGYPTTSYINQHPQAYNNPNLTNW